MKLCHTWIRDRRSQPGPELEAVFLKVEVGLGLQDEAESLAQVFRRNGVGNNDDHPA